MDNVDITLGHIREFKDPTDGTLGASSSGDLLSSRLVWAGLSSSSNESPHHRLTALDGSDFASLDASFFSSSPFASSPVPALPTADTRFAGSYRRKQGLGLRYTYSGFYGVNSQGSWWQVAVRCSRVPRGMPMGVVKGMTLPEETQIRRLVEHAIEDLDQLKE